MPHLYTEKEWGVFEWELIPKFYKSLGTLQKEIQRYRDLPYGIKKLQNGGNGRHMVVAFDSLRPEIKNAIGDPRKTDNVLERYYTICNEAVKVYSGYEFEDGSVLTSRQQEEYVINASVIKAALKLYGERSAMRGTERKVMESILCDAQAFNHTLHAKHGVKHTLPTSEKRFKQLLKDFRTPWKTYEFNYGSLISGKLRNKNSAKIKEGEVSQDLIHSLLEHPNQYDDVYIAHAYNQKAKQLGLKPITDATVGIWRRKLDHVVKPMREGWNVWKDEYSRTVKRHRPTHPCYLWESDDNHLDLLFNGDDNNPYHRFKVIFVTDSYSDLILGYACCEGELHPDLVKLAYLNAMYYVRSLTGGWYVPHEIKTDRWRLQTLRPYYQKIAHYYDTPVNSKNRGWLENLFGCEDWKRCLKTDADGTPAINYTGNNITAKNAGYNREMSRINAKLFPHMSEAPAQIAAFVHRMRHIDLEGKGSREQRWLEAWGNMPEGEKKTLTDAEFMRVFGLPHDPRNGERNSIDRSGVTATLMGEKISYAVPPALYLPNVGKKVDVYYDPFDLSRVLVTDNERIRFIAQQITGIPGTMRDMQVAGEGQRAFLNTILNQKRADVDYIVEQRDKRLKRLAEQGIDIDHVLSQGGYIAKEIAQDAETQYLINDIGGDEPGGFKPWEGM